MTFRVAVLIFVVSFAAITGWLVMRTPADIDVIQTPPPTAQPAETPAPKDKEQNDEESGTLAISDQDRDLKKALQSAIIPVLDLHETPLDEALAILNLKLRETQSTQFSSLSFIVRTRPEPGDLGHDLPDPMNQHITLRAENISVANAMDRICQQSRHHWRIEDETLVLSPLE